MGDLSLLEGFPNLRAISVTADIPTRDLSVLNQFSLLEEISVNEGCFRPNFKGLPNLRSLAVPYAGDQFTASGSSALKELVVSRWGNEDLQSLSGFSALEVLGIKGGRLQSLKGLTAFRNLRHLWLYKLIKLIDFSELACLKDLEVLDIDTCKGLENLDVIHGLGRLQKLYINNVGPIPTLRPVAALSCLRTLHFVESTDIRDGDTDLVNRMGLKDFGFQNRRHYNFIYDHANWPPKW